MFDRFLTYARARRAIKAGQFETALRLMRDPSIAAERRASQLAQQALAGILHRARRRGSDGNLDAARADVERIVADSPEFDGATTLSGELEDAAQTARTRLAKAADMRREARQHAERGDLETARRLCDQAARIQPDCAEQAAVVRLVENCENALAADLDGLAAALDASDLEALRRLVSRVGQRPDPTREARELRARATRLAATLHQDRLAEHAGEQGVCLDEIAADARVFEGLLAQPELARALDQRAEAVARQFHQALGGGDFAAAAVCAEAAHPLVVGRSPLAPLGPGIEALREALSSEARGDLGRALERMCAAAEAFPQRPLRQAAERLAKAEAAAALTLEQARAIASDGQLLAARETLATVLQTWPMHEPLRREMDILNRQTEDRESRLQHARTLAAESRLAEASGILLSLASDSDEGREARLLLKDVHRRMDLAAKGLSQVRRAVHGQATANREGLRHCVARLDEVAKLQADLAEGDALRSQLLAEIEALDRLDAIHSGMESGDVDAVDEALAEFEALRPAMLHADRLDARFLDLADRILRRAEGEMHLARLTAAGRWITAVARHAKGHVTLQARTDSLAAEVADGRRRAESILERLEGSSERSGVGDRLDLLDEARAVWVDCPQIGKVEARVMALQHHANSADEIEHLTSTGDVRGARRKLGDMPPTPGFLRTRIFDLKQELARAQGLEGGFLLRVDEGGEYLVLRDDSITFGNMREHKADVRVLANVSGLHARLRRSLSFHGGMEDRVVAEHGEVFVNGARVETAVMKPGDRVRLGPNFEFVYKVPSKRSLAVLLELKSGFQIAGTDKILLMKDRGRDGRLLIGRADDAHVRVPHDESEVEVYGASDGQVRVRYSGNGEIDRRPFSGEHPVSAGSWVRCGSTSFVLQPWEGTAP